MKKIISSVLSRALRAAFAVAFIFIIAPAAHAQTATCPAGFTCTPANPVASTSVQISNTFTTLGAPVTQNNQIVSYPIQFSFTLTAGSVPIYIGNSFSSPQPLKRPVVFVAGNDILPMISGISANPISLSGDTSSYYMIPAGSSRSFVLSGSLNKDDAQYPEGVNVVQVTEIDYRTSMDSTYATPIYGGLDNLKTSVSFGSTTPTCPAGFTCTPANPISTPGADGTIAISQNGSTFGVGNNVTFNLQAGPSSDMQVNDLSVDFSNRPWQYFSTFSLVNQATGKVIVPATSLSQSDFTEVAVADYRYIFGGINLILPRGQADSIVLSGQGFSSTSTTNIISASVRAVDDNGVTQTSSTSSGSVPVTPVNPPTSCYQWSAYLGVGSTGADVVALQAWLNGQGFSNLPTTGYFGEATAAAVVKLQQSVGIPATGYVGPLTIAYLNRNACGTTPVTTTCPVGYVCTTPVTTTCPAGYVCTAPGQTTACPAGYTCTPVAITTCPTGWTCSTETAPTEQPSSAPVISYISPTTANPLNLITIYGSGFYSLYTSIGIDGPSPFPNDSPNSVSSDGTQMTIVLPQSLSSGQYSITASNLVNGTWVRSSGSANLVIASAVQTPPVVTSRPPVISFGNLLPTSLLVGQAGTWTAMASDPQNSPLNYSVTWGDGIASSHPTAQPAGSAGTFTHSYSAAGTYTVTFTATNSAGLSAHTSAVVQVQSATVPPTQLQSSNMYIYSSSDDYVPSNNSTTRGQDSLTSSIWNAIRTYFTP